MPPSTERTPWRAMLAGAMQVGVQPKDFWRLSLREWRALTAPIETSLSRTAFDALAREHPDEAT